MERCNSVIITCIYGEIRVIIDKLVQWITCIYNGGILYICEYTDKREQRMVKRDGGVVGS